jgi:hypothetical protein
MKTSLKLERVDVISGGHAQQCKAQITNKQFRQGQ